MSARAGFEDRFQKISDALEQAIDKALKGEPIPLPELEAEVTRLSGDLAKAEPDLAQSFQPHMAEMITKLDELVRALKEKKD